MGISPTIKARDLIVGSTYRETFSGIRKNRTIRIYSMDHDAQPGFIKFIYTWVEVPHGETGLVGAKADMLQRLDNELHLELLQYMITEEPDITDLISRRRRV